MRNLPPAKFYHVCLWFCALILIIIAIKSLPTKQLRVVRKSPDWSLQYVLANANQVDIGQINNGQEDHVASLPNGNNMKMFLLLKQATRFHAIPSRLKPDFIVEVPIVGNKPIYSATGPSPFPTYKYNCEDGKLGTGNDWCYVPNEFKAWMLMLKLRAPIHSYRVVKTPYYTAIQEVKHPKVH